jgi:Flp pilus assembly protein TadG
MSMLRYIASKRGQSVVEFSLAAPLFFVAFYAIVEFSHLFYVRLTAQHALDEAARYMSTGQSPDLGDPGARLAKIQNIFCNNLVAAGIACPVLNVNAPKGNVPGEIVTITANVNKAFFTGIFRMLDGLFPTSVTMTVSTIYQNECWSPCLPPAG